MKKTKSAKMKREEASDLEKSNKTQPAEIIIDKVRFETWFAQKLSQKRLELWQKSSILEFFKSHSLNIKEEDIQKYEKVLKSF